MIHLPDSPSLHVEDLRSENAPAVVLIHDFRLDRRVWGNVAKRLPSQVRCVIPDLRGYGHSPAPDRQWSMRDVVYDLANTLFSLNIRDAIVVGSGTGGMIAQALAAEVPQAVRALVLIGTGAKLETEDRWLHRAQVLSGLPDTARVRQLLEAATYRAPDPHLCEIAASTRPDTLRRMCEAVAHTDLRRSTDALRLPTLGLVGRNDRITPPDLMREMIDGIPGASLELLPRCGHITAYDAPEATADAINGFLDRTGHLLPDFDSKDPS